MNQVNAAIWIPWLPAIAAIACGVCCTKAKWRSYAPVFCIASIALGFLISIGVATQVEAGKPAVAHAFDWINVGGLRANMSYYIDALTVVMLFVVTGIGTLVAIYASGYMKGDKGYARFFVGVSLFIFAMTTLVLADNLVLLYLGWEGVGLCSYLLIGFYYEKPSAVAAAKKAFIVNRIGDLGFALGIFLIYTTFGTVEYAELFHVIESGQYEAGMATQVIPFLLMLGAFGKSAQIPLYVWLPDAMEGPTPVSALIHAATMVTAGVYMIARLIPVFELSQSALPVVAVIGAFTALFAATIALCQYDIKRIWAYSTISQLGYMFLGVGVLSTAGGVFHLFTHAFFKALLFLTAGSVMHALAGQLDLRKMSGLRTKMPVTCWLMFAGCLALAGFPFTAGFFSKDEILAAAIQRGQLEHAPLFTLLGIIGLLAALLTAYYTFRLWFRVFLGPTHYEMGDEHHAADDAHGDDHDHDHHHDAHEMPWLMNGPLVVLAVGAIFAGWLHHWMGGMVAESSAAIHPATAGVPHGGDHGEHHASLMGMDLHTAMMVISSIIAITGIAIAAYFHLLNRSAADRMKEHYQQIVTLLENKYYIDEIYDAIIVRPLRAIGYVCFVIDQLIIDGIVQFVGFVPRAMGLTVQPMQRGVLQGYGVGMLGGIMVLVLIVLMVM